MSLITMNYTKMERLLTAETMEHDMQLPLSECNLDVMGGANPNLTLLDCQAPPMTSREGKLDVIWLHFEKCNFASYRRHLLELLWYRTKLDWVENSEFR